MGYTTNEYAIPQSNVMHDWSHMQDYVNSWIDRNSALIDNSGESEEFTILPGLPDINGFDGDYVQGSSFTGIGKEKMKFDIRYSDEVIDVGPYKVKMDKIIKDIKREMDNLKENKDTIFAYRILKVALEDIEAKYKNALEFKKAKIKKEIKV